MLVILILLLVLLAFELIFRQRSFLSSLAHELYRFGRYESSEKLFEKALGESDVPGNANLAKSRYKQGEFDAAEEAAQRALELDEEDPMLLYDLGNIAFEKGDYQAAVEHYSEALLRDHQDDDIRANLELALRKLDENPPQPEPEGDDVQEEEQDPEQYRNILDALDNLEAQDRQNRARRSPPKTENWW